MIVRVSVVLRTIVEMTLDDVSATKVVDFITINLLVSSIGRALRSLEPEEDRASIS